MHHVVWLLNSRLGSWIRFHVSEAGVSGTGCLCTSVSRNQDPEPVILLNSDPDRRGYWNLFRWQYKERVSYIFLKYKILHVLYVLYACCGAVSTVQPEATLMLYRTHQPTIFKSIHNLLKKKKTCKSWLNMNYSESKGLVNLCKSCF